MPELRQEYMDILEKREWSVSSYTDDGRTEITTERFGWCSEKKCMAYNNGRCKRLEREENQ